MGGYNQGQNEEIDKAIELWPKICELIKQDYRIKPDFNECKKILKIAEILNCKIITTEKDFLRIKHEKINKIKSVKSKLEIIDEDNFIKKILEI